MPVKLRLQRHGRKKRPYYHIVAADGRTPRDGRFIERIGWYDPTKQPAVVDVDVDKALEWLQNGAQPTNTVRNILSVAGVMYKKHLMRGVHKGALSEVQANDLFEQWKEKRAKKKKVGMALYVPPKETLEEVVVPKPKPVAKKEEAKAKKEEAPKKAKEEVKVAAKEEVKVAAKKETPVKEVVTPKAEAVVEPKSEAVAKAEKATEEAIKNADEQLDALLDNDVDSVVDEIDAILESSARSRQSRCTRRCTMC